MAEIIRSLTNSQTFPLYPARELCPKSANEVYEVIGNHLIDLYEKDIPLESKAFLVGLDSGQEIAFKFEPSIVYKERQEVI